MLSLCPFDISVGVGAFVIGLSQISSFFSSRSDKQKRSTEGVIVWSRRSFTMVLRIIELAVTIGKNPRPWYNTYCCCLTCFFWYTDQCNTSRNNCIYIRFLIREWKPQRQSFTYLHTDYHFSALAFYYNGNKQSLQKGYNWKVNSSSKKEYVRVVDCGGDFGASERAYRHTIDNTLNKFKKLNKK